MTGIVSLVGAGPGDPELLTLKAVDRLRRADLVLYDALLDPAVLDHAPRARKLYVGKRAGRRSMNQRLIERLMVRGASRGERVVRLKGGDPFVLGRGGEEALALVAAGVPCEVVPGVSSAIAAPAAAGIPVTHRGLSSGFLVVSGHAREPLQRALGSITPQSMTVVVLMGLAQRATLAELLLTRGWDPATPAAVVVGATTPACARWLGELAELPAASWEERESATPATLVIGPSVGLAETLTALEPQSNTTPPAVDRCAIAGAPW